MNIKNKNYAQIDGFRNQKGLKRVFDKNGELVATVGKEEIYDKHGDKLASFEGYEKVGRKKHAVYKTKSGEKYTFSKGKLSLNGAPLGFAIKAVRAFPLLTAMIAAVFAVSVAVVSINHDYIPEDYTPVITVYDANGSWGNYGTVAVFDDKIYPGTSGVYEFHIKNSNNFEVEYSFSLDHFYDNEELSSFPLLYKLKLGKTYLTDKWANANELVFDSIIINSKKTQEFVLEWFWPFENEVDNNIDTWLGADHGKYVLNINLTAQVYKR